MFQVEHSVVRDVEPSPRSIQPNEADCKPATASTQACVNYIEHDSFSPREIVRVGDGAAGVGETPAQNTATSPEVQSTVLLEEYTPEQKRRIFYAEYARLSSASEALSHQAEDSVDRWPVDLWNKPVWEEAKAWTAELELAAELVWERSKLMYHYANG